MDHSFELILKRFRVRLHKHLLLQCITTPPGCVLHVARAQNRPVAAAIADIALAVSLSRSLNVKSVES